MLLDYRLGAEGNNVGAVLEVGADVRHREVSKHRIPFSTVVGQRVEFNEREGKVSSDEIHDWSEFRWEGVRAIKHLWRESGGAEGVESFSEAALKEALNKSDCVTKHVAV